MTVSEEELDPRVQALLEEEIEDRDLDMAVVRELLAKAQTIEGEELEQLARRRLKEA